MANVQLFGPSRTCENTLEMMQLDFVGGGSTHKKKTFVMTMERPEHQEEFGNALLLAVGCMFAYQKITNFAVCVSSKNENMMIVFTIVNPDQTCNVRRHYGSIITTQLKQWAPNYTGKMLAFTPLITQHVRQIDQNCVTNGNNIVIAPRDYQIYIIFAAEPFQVYTMLIRDTEKLE
jgi:hypothetical protein